MERRGEYKSAGVLEKMIDENIQMALQSQDEQLMVPKSLPLILEILDAIPLHGIKVPTLEKYNRKMDPFNYLQHFQSMMNLHCILDAI